MTSKDRGLAGQTRASMGSPLQGEAFWQALDAEIAGSDARAVRAAMPEWALFARPAQLPPAGDWRQWVMIGGRGSGKTRAGAEWVRAMALGRAPMASRMHGRIALLAETLGDAREVMIEGESGLRALDWAVKPVFEATRRRLVFSNGAVAQCFSSEDPEALRGYQFDAAWGDEFAKWKHAEDCFDNLQLGLRLGATRAHCSPRRRAPCRFSNA